MKKLVVLMVAITLGLTTAVSAKMLPTTAAKLPADFKQEISKHLDYPKDAQDNYVEGEVWMKITLDENSKVRIVDLSATSPILGTYVKEELSELTIKNTSFPIGNVYFMKVKFELIN
ncbi:MAG: hypothetical protein JEZ09_18490 [Salinivirgaceae bacterium]|nr:hypothetical protein [Salinivirgaceae bacterium]